MGMALALRERARWRSWQQAVIEYYSRKDDGYPIKSTSDPSRFEGLNIARGATALGDRAQSMAEDYAPISRLIEEAYRQGLTLGRVHYGTELCAKVFELLAAGFPEKRGGVTYRLTVSPEEVAQAASRYYFIPIGADEALEITAIGARYLEAYMLERGLVEGTDRRLTAPAMSGGKEDSAEKKEGGAA